MPKKMVLKKNREIIMTTSHDHRIAMGGRYDSSPEQRFQFKQLEAEGNPYGRNIPQLVLFIQCMTENFHSMRVMCPENTL